MIFEKYMSALFVFFTLMLCLFSGTSLAQTETSGSTGSEIEEIRQLAKKKGVPVVIISPEQKVKQQKKSKVEYLGAVRAHLSEFRRRLTTLLANSGDALSDISTTVSKSIKGPSRVSLVVVMLGTTGLLILMKVFEYFYHQWLSVKCKKIWPDKPRDNSEKMALILTEYLGRAVGVVVLSLIVFILADTLYGRDKTSELTIIALVSGVAAGSLLVEFWRVWIAPEEPDYRLPNLDDEEARMLFYWLIVGSIVTVFLAEFVIWINELGMAQKSLKVLYLLSGSIFFTYLCILLVRNRTRINKIIGIERLSALSGFSIRRFLSLNWLYLSLVYIFASWITITFRLVMDLPRAFGHGVGMIIILMVSLTFYALGTILTDRCLRPIYRNSEEETLFDDETASEASRIPAESTEKSEKQIQPSLFRTKEFSAFARQMVAILTFCFAGGSLLLVWGVGVLDPDGVIVKFWDAILIGVVGYFVYQSTRIIAKTKIEQKLSETPSGTPQSNLSRLATLLPLFRNFILVVIVIIFGLMILARMGVNIAPLLGGAGVIGLALGFGAQTMVRDIFSGAFFLADDSFRKGEIIDVDAVRGTIEKISIRSMQIRSIDGCLHTIPFGDIKMVSNYSRDWAMMKLKLRLTFDTDEVKVRKLLKQLGKDLQNDPEIGDLFLQPMKSQGITKMDDSAMIIGVKFKTRPGDQWLARRYVFAKIRELFQKEGIKFANREVTVHLSEEDTQNLDADTKQKIAGSVLPLMESNAVKKA